MNVLFYELPLHSGHYQPVVVMKTALIIFLLAMPLWAYPQYSRQQLEAERKNTLQKIENANKVLQETAQHKRSELSQLRAILRQIDQRQQLINNISREIYLIEEDIYETKDIVKALNQDLEELKKEYASMIYLSSKSRNSSAYQKLSFIFASESVNQMLSRVHYLNHYTQNREYQMEQIVQVADMLEGKMSALESQKEDRKQLLVQEKAQQWEMEQLRRKQASLVKALSTKEKELKYELAQEQAALQQLDRTLNPVSQNALVAAGSNSEGADVHNFETNRMRLPWPVEKGFISGKFGKQKHPVFEDVWTDNLGVDITAPKDAKVMAVFGGVVKAVTQVVGMQQVVMVQHGKFFTVYARLKNVRVKPGESLAIGQEIGEVSVNKEGTSMLQFQIWEQQKKLNPEDWLVNEPMSPGK